jgi:hypothetical protein
MNFNNNLWGGHCLVSLRTRLITDGKVTTFLTLAYDGDIPLMFLSKWRELSPGLAAWGWGVLMAVRVSMLKLRASPDTLPFKPCETKDLQFTTWKPHLSVENIDSVLRHGELSRANDLSAPPHITLCYMFKQHVLFMWTEQWNYK